MTAILDTILPTVDTALTSIIAIPVLFCTYARVIPIRKTRKIAWILLKISKVLIAVFLIRCFLDEFIFTPANYYRFMDSPWLPVLETLFY